MPSCTRMTSHAHRLHEVCCGHQLEGRKLGDGEDAQACSIFLAAKGACVGRVCAWLCCVWAALAVPLVTWGSRVRRVRPNRDVDELGCFTRGGRLMLRDTRRGPTRTGGGGAALCRGRRQTGGRAPPVCVFSRIYRVEASAGHAPGTSNARPRRAGRHRRPPRARHRDNSEPGGLTPTSDIILINRSETRYECTPSAWKMSTTSKLLYRASCLIHWWRVGERRD